MSIKLNTDATVNLNVLRLAAVEKHLAPLADRIPIDGAMRTPAEVAAIFQRTLDSHAAVVEAQAAYKAALEARKKAMAAQKRADECLKPWVLSRFGANSAAALSFAYAPRKQPVMTAETKARAVLLNAATRRARMTMGKKQRLRIRGKLVAAVAAAAAVAGAPRPEGEPATRGGNVSPAASSTRDDVHGREPPREPGQILGVAGVHDPAPA